jgi:hypothetical protein
VHYFDPHRPYLPPDGHGRPYGEAVDLTGKLIPKDVADEEELSDLIRAYRGEVGYTDAQAGPGDGPPASLEAVVGDETGPGRTRRVDAETRRALEALGYAE